MQAVGFILFCFLLCREQFSVFSVNSFLLRKWKRSEKFCVSDHGVHTVLFRAQLIPVILCLRILPFTGISSSPALRVEILLMEWCRSCTDGSLTAALQWGAAACWPFLSAQARVASIIPRFINKVLFCMKPKLPSPWFSIPEFSVLSLNKHVGLPAHLQQPPALLWSHGKHRHVLTSSCSSAHHTASASPPHHEGVPTSLLL